MFCFPSTVYRRETGRDCSYTTHANDLFAFFPSGREKKEEKTNQPLLRSGAFDFILPLRAFILNESVSNLKKKKRKKQQHDAGSAFQSPQHQRRLVFALHLYVQTPVANKQAMPIKGAREREGNLL